jgi:endoglucanase
VGWPEWRVTEVMAERPGVRVNQFGYLPDRPKHATLISDARGPIHFTVRDESGIAVFTGLSEPWPVRPEPTSGLIVHVLDFRNFNMPGAGFRIEAAAQCSHPFESPAASTTCWQPMHCASST